jgi:hypothetical protein
MLSAACIFVIFATLLWIILFFWLFVTFCGYRSFAQWCNWVSSDGAQRGQQARE